MWWGWCCSGTGGGGGVPFILSIDLIMRPLALVLLPGLVHHDFFFVRLDTTGTCLGPSSMVHHPFPLAPYLHRPSPKTFRGTDGRGLTPRVGP